MPRPPRRPRTDQPAAGPPSGGNRGSEGAGSEERLQRTLARAGYGSRRSVESLIRDGRVRINDRVAELGNRADPLRDRVSVDGVPVPTHPELRYFALNKPPGVTTTLRDRHAAQTVADLLPEGPRVIPVGRLDRESEGLLLLTNDGELAHRLQHPRYGVEKEYLVEVNGALPRGSRERLLRGMVLEDGPIRAQAVGPVHRDRNRSAVTVVMGEGRKRVVRRMFQSLGLPVTRLVRVRLGPIKLGRLAPGETRPLRAEEVRALYGATGLEQAAPGASRQEAAAASRPRRSGRLRSSRSRGGEGSPRRTGRRDST